MVLLSIIAALFLIYAALIIYFWQSWTSIPVFKTNLTAPLSKLSVIIPARNEEANMGALLQSIAAQTYPKTLLEVIVVDDNSTDRTASIAKEFPFVKLISLKEDSINSYKKKAIEIGVAAASGDLVITTDADCITQPNWLSIIEAFYRETNSVFIVAPVAIDFRLSLVHLFQSMDFMVLQGVTGASVHRQMLTMCNGANLAYERKAFFSVNGFSGIDHIASGDDMLLMYKIWNKFAGRIHYLKSKEVTVSTQPAETWAEFLSQRIRWASKADKFDDKRIFRVLMIVYLFNLSFLFLLVAGFWNSIYWWGLVIFLAAKTLIEFPFITSVATFFHKQSLLKYFIFFQPLHILYTIIAGWLGKFGSYHWKGRKVK